MSLHLQQDSDQIRRFHVQEKNIIMELPWTSKSALLLIDEYKKHPLLYDHNHSGYVSKSQRHEAWLAIAQHFFTDVNSVKMKVNSLLASFRREYRKKRDKPNSVSGWFAYEHMKFLIQSRRTANTSSPLSKMEPPPQEPSQLTLHTKIEFDDDSNTFDYEFVDIADQDTENENFEDTLDESILDSSPLDSTTPSSDPTLDHASPRSLALNDQFQSQMIPDQPIIGRIQPLAVAKKPLTLKRKKITKDDLITVDGSEVQQPQNAQCATGASCSVVSDESAVFAQHIANKMRKYSGRTRAMVEHAISNILFEADMGKYDKE